MPKISLTDFVEIVSRSGMPKYRKVLEVKERGEYAPAFDFYKPLREHLAEVHRSGHTKQYLASLLPTLTDPKKMTNYPSAIEGYSKWWGNKTIEWFDPPRHLYIAHGMELAINPELGLKFKSAQYVIKLYLKATPLSQLRVQIITELMQRELGAAVSGETTFSVLDVRKSKLFSCTSGSVISLPLVNAELAYISSIWNAAPQ